ncbi:hypothetical protein CesoFtcFv8_013272 [Champsocephalus esox]|uniref:Uncharacterized protein n=1 Tax=Champsocephalus esox TaxID=159716 RepID=A0AAN8GYQ2_9TELE|nr:hypothetical protein CesoFtcFv8_013272 [Champsocephalus esox]
MRPRDIFDLEWLDNHPELSPDFHLSPTLKLHKQPATLELIRVITALPLERTLLQMWARFAVVLRVDAEPSVPFDRLFADASA